MRINKEFKVGIFAITACSVLYIGFNFLKGIQLFSPSNSYYTHFEHAHGLEVGNPVSFDGLNVGRVSSINILQDGRDAKFLVKMTVRSDLKLGHDVKAAIIVSVLGEKEVRLRFSDVTQILGKNDSIPGSVEMSITDILKEKAVPILTKLDSSAALVNALLEVLNANKEKLNLTFSNIESATKHAEMMLANSRSNVETISKNLSELTYSLNDETNGLKGLLTKLNGIADTVQHAELGQLMANANGAIESMNKSLNKIGEGTGTLGKLVNDESLYTNLNISVRSLDSLLVNLRENPKRYVHFSVFGKKNK